MRHTLSSFPITTPDMTSLWQGALSPLLFRAAGVDGNRFDSVHPSLVGWPWASFLPH